MKLKNKLNVIGCICFFVGVIFVALFCSEKASDSLLEVGMTLIIASVPFAITAGIRDYRRNKVKNRKKKSVPKYHTVVRGPKREFVSITELADYKKPEQDNEKETETPLKETACETYDIYKTGEIKKKRKRKK